MHGPHLENHCPRQFHLAPNISCRPVTATPGSLLRFELWVSGTSLVSFPSLIFLAYCSLSLRNRDFPDFSSSHLNNLNAPGLSPRTTFSSYSFPECSHPVSQLQGRLCSNSGLSPGFLAWARCIQ